MRGGRVQVMNGESAGWMDNMNRDGLSGWTGTGSEWGECRVDG